MFALLGWFALLLLGGALIAFWNDVKAWVTDVFNEIRPYAEKAVVYIQRIPGAVKGFVYFLKNGCFKKSEHNFERLTPEDLRRMVENKFLTKEQGDKLLQGKEIEIGNQTFRI